MRRCVLLATTSLLLLAGCRSSGPSTSRYPRPIPTAKSGPVLFSPAYVSSGLDERDAAFSLDGNVFAFTQLEGRRGRIVLLRAGDPEFAPFTTDASDIEPFFDPRGGALWFASDRPHPDDPAREDWNLWRVSFDEDGWGEPELVRGLDGPGDEFYPSVARDGTLAFTASRPGGQGGEDVWLAHPDEAGGWRVENPGPAVNSPGDDYNALLSPAGDLLVFSSERDGDQGGGDLYASARRVPPSLAEPTAENGEGTDAEGEDPPPPYFVVEPAPDGGWSRAVPLAPYNSPTLDYCPALTPDGRYLVFTSRREVRRFPEPETFPQVRARLTGPGNGRGDLWWALAPTVLQEP